MLSLYDQNTGNILPSLTLSWVSTEGERKTLPIRNPEVIAINLHEGQPSPILARIPALYHLP
jgi:hypothetical protein